jgi:predicted nucleic acid-binding protein
LVIIDTSIWVPALRTKDAPEKQKIAALVRSGEAAIVGIILVEVLRGARSLEDYEELNEQLHAAYFVPDSEGSWLRSARLIVELKQRGETIPLPDAIIAAQALEGFHSVLANDVHFERVPGLKLA